MNDSERRARGTIRWIARKAQWNSPRGVSTAVFSLINRFSLKIHPLCSLSLLDSFFIVSAPEAPDRGVSPTLFDHWDIQLLLPAGIVVCNAVNHLPVFFYIHTNVFAVYDTSFVWIIQIAVTLAWPFRSVERTRTSFDYFSLSYTKRRGDTAGRQWFFLRTVSGARLL